MEDPVGFEPTTNWLRANCSTPELRIRICPSRNHRFTISISFQDISEAFRIRFSEIILVYHERKLKVLLEKFRKWCARGDSNPRPTVPKTVALSS